MAMVAVAAASWRRVGVQARIGEGGPRTAPRDAAAIPAAAN